MLRIGKQSKAALGMVVVLALGGCGPAGDDQAEPGTAESSAAPAVSLGADPNAGGPVVARPTVDLCDSLDLSPIAAVLGEPRTAPEESTPTACKRDLNTLDAAPMDAFYGSVTVVLYVAGDKPAATGMYDDGLSRPGDFEGEPRAIGGVGEEAAFTYVKGTKLALDEPIKGLMLHTRQDNVLLRLTVIAGRKKFSGTLWTQADLDRLVVAMGKVAQGELSGLR